MSHSSEKHPIDDTITRSRQIVAQSKALTHKNAQRKAQIQEKFCDSLDSKSNNSPANRLSEKYLTDEATNSLQSKSSHEGTVEIKDFHKKECLEELGLLGTIQKKDEIIRDLKIKVASTKAECKDLKKQKDHYKKKFNELSQDFEEYKEKYKELLKKNISSEYPTKTQSLESKILSLEEKVNYQIYLNQGLVEKLWKYRSCEDLSPKKLTLKKNISDHKLNSLESTPRNSRKSNQKSTAKKSRCPRKDRKTPKKLVI